MNPITAVLALALLLAGPSAPAAEADWLDEYDALLAKYVVAGGVKYEQWRASKDDREALARVVEGIAGEDTGDMTRDERLAFHLNAYNAWILHRILADYPTKGPGGGGLFGRNRFFKAKVVKVAGETTSFHLLENEIIRPTYDEPRIHFAINCASRSCPPLHGRAFRGEDLDAVLDKLTTAFVNDNPSGVKPDGKGRIAVSKIFDWFEEDFAKAGSLIDFLNQYRREKIPAGTKVSFQKYHWTLNLAE